METDGQTAKWAAVVCGGRGDEALVRSDKTSELRRALAALATRFTVAGSPSPTASLSPSLMPESLLHSIRLLLCFLVCHIVYPDHILHVLSTVPLQLTPTMLATAIPAQLKLLETS